MPLFDTHVVVDWSARSTPSPARPSKDAIFWAVVRDGVLQAVDYARTRAAARTQLAQLIAQEQAHGRRMLLGFDFAFGYPAGVAKTLTGQDSALHLWDWIAARVEDADDNANNRFAVASQINRAFPGVGPMWGRPDAWDYPDVPPKKSARHGDHPADQRQTERFAVGAKSVWQMAYAGAVGSQVVLGLPTVKFLRDTTGAVVWPFDTDLRVPDADVVIAEIYPSLLQAQAHASQGQTEVLDAAQVRVLARAFADLDQTGALAPFFTPKAPDPDSVAQEGWIFGTGPDLSLKHAVSTAQVSHAPL